jgi:outer membrane protein OmpA-like peptidoglycan-associated protein
MPEENDTGWQKVSFNYKANGQEIYITLGNFSRGNMPAKLRKTPDRHVLIFIDNISISPADPSESICPDWQERKNEIYAFNARHFYLEDYINFKSRQAPNPPQLSKTTVVKIDTLIIPDILFETGKSTLTQKSNAFLDSVSIELYAKKIDSMVVEGHTDSIGSLASNQKLSYDRANTVADYFKAKLVSATYITRGWASAKPVAANTTPAGRQKNRRVEIYLYVRD